MPKNRIDTHFHMLPQFWTDALIKKTGKQLWGVPEWSFETAIATMDRLETATAIISLATPSVSVWVGHDQLDMTKRVNHFGLELVARARGRLGYFATVPMPNVDHTLKEIGRAFDEYHADGVILLSSYKGVYLGDKIFDPVWAALNKRKAVVLMKPGVPDLKPLEGVPLSTVDFPMDSTRCALSLVTGGMMERYPDVKIILSHAGGFLPYAGHRFARAASMTTRPRSKASRRRTFSRTAQALLLRHRAQLARRPAQPDGLRSPRSCPLRQR